MSRSCNTTVSSTGSTSGGVVSIDVLEVDELQVNSAIKLSKAAAATTNFGEFQVEENRMQLDPESSFNSLNFSAPNIVLDGNVSILGVASTIRQTDIQTTSIQMYDNVATIGEANTQNSDKGVHVVYYNEETTTNKHDFIGTTFNLRPTSTKPIFTYLTHVTGMDKPEIAVTDADKVYKNVFYKTFQSDIIGDAEFSRVYLNTLHTNNHSFINQDKLTLTNGTNIFEVNFGTKTVESIPEIIIYSYPTYAKLPTLTFKNTVTETPDYFDPLKSVDMNTTSGVIDFGTTTNFSRIGSGQETSTTNLGKLSILVKNNSKYKDFRFESDGFINTHKLNVDSVLISNHGMEIKGIKYRVINWTSSETTDSTVIDLRLNPTHNLVSGDSTFIMIEEYTPVKYFNNNIYKAYYKDTEYIRIHLPKTEVNIPFPLPYSVMTYSINVYFVQSKEDQNLIEGTKFNKSRILTQQHYKFSYNNEFNLLPGKLNLNNNKNEGILLENNNSCLKISTKRSTFYLTSSKKPYFNIIEKPKNYLQNNLYGSSSESATSTTTTSTTTGVYIPSYVIDSAHAHEGNTISTSTGDVTESSNVFISKTKLLLFIESSENYQQITDTIVVEDSVTIVTEEKIETDKRPMIIFNDHVDSYQRTKTSENFTPVSNTISSTEEKISNTKTKLVLFGENSDNYQQIQATKTSTSTPTTSTESSKEKISKTKLVLFGENSDNYLQIQTTKTSTSSSSVTSTESSKEKISKTKLVLFSENSDNYLQIQATETSTSSSVTSTESSKEKISKTKLVLFGENSDNYLQIKPVVSTTSTNNTITSTNSKLLKKSLLLNFNMDNSLLSYDYSKNTIFNETTINNTLNVKRLNTTSDIRMKENIKLLSGESNYLDNVNCYSFNFKNSQTKVYGVIAQEIEEVLPNLVSEVSDIKRVDYTQFTPLLIDSIKTIKKENSSLKDRVKILEEKVNKLMSLLE
jgi:hypothetical protein